MELIESADVRLLSAATLLESSIVIEARKRRPGVTQLDFFLRKAGVQIFPVTEQQAQVAREAYVRFGKGHHPAKLNFGDCFSYALCKVTGEPLLFKGHEFPQTDLSLLVS